MSSNSGRNSRNSTKAQTSENAASSDETGYSMTEVCKLLTSIKTDLSELYVLHVTPLAKITSAKPENILPPACASIANRSMITVPETLLAVNILTDILREIIKNYPFINFKPIQPPWGLSKRIILLNYFLQNSTNISICIYNQFYSSHSLYLYIYCCYYHILLNSVFPDVLYCIMTSWIYSFLEKTLIASLRPS